MKRASSYLKTMILPAAIGLCLLAAASCVTTRNDVEYLNNQIIALNKRVNALEGDPKGTLAGQIRRENETLRQSQAELFSDMNNIKSEMQELRGRLEDNSLTLKQMAERTHPELDSVNRKITELAERLTLLEARVENFQVYFGISDKAPPKDPAKGEEAAGTETEETGPSKPEEPSEKEDARPDEKLYNATLNLYENKKYREAIRGFEAFLKNFSDSELADNAQFWIAESHMALEQYEQAILAYQNVIKKYPDENKVPNALLRQAVAFEKINDKISSKVLLKKLISKYPDSPEAATAKARLKKLQ